MTESSDIINVVEADFEKEVLEHSRTRPVLVDFWAKWCGPCVKLKPILEEAATRKGGAIRLAKIDTDANPNLSSAFGISSIPAVMMFRDGKPVDSFVGLLSPAELDVFIDRWLPKPADLLLEQAGKAMEKGQKDQARDLCEKALAMNSDLDAARLMLAGLLLEEKGKTVDAAAVETLLEPLSDSGPSGPEVLRLKARLFFARLAQGGKTQGGAAEKAGELFVKAGEKAMNGDPEGAIEDLLAAGEIDLKLAKGPVKEGLIQCFHLLGENHPRLSGYRNRLMMILT